MSKKSGRGEKINIKTIAIILLFFLLGTATGGGIGVNINPETGEVIIKANYTLELAEEQKTAIIETDTGIIEMEAPTVEAIDGAELAEECGEAEECGHGWYVDITTPTTFKNATFGQCIDTDGHYGSQCWDLGNLFWQNATGRTLSTWGTGAAKGTILDGAWQHNAGDEFVMIWDATKLKAGDWVVFTNGQYGHIGMAMGSYNNGYIALLGTNQGGASCAGGGSSTNIINISLKNFGGAFRYKEYIEPEPIPEPVSEGAYIVKKGDTLGQIARDEGWYMAETGLFGDDGYTQKLAEYNGIENRGLIYPGQEIRSF